MPRESFSISSNLTNVIFSKDQLFHFGFPSWDSWVAQAKLCHCSHHISWACVSSSEWPLNLQGTGPGHTLKHPTSWLNRKGSHHGSARRCVSSGKHRPPAWVPSSIPSCKPCSNIPGSCSSFLQQSPYLGSKYIDDLKGHLLFLILGPPDTR